MLEQPPLARTVGMSETTVWRIWRSRGSFGSVKELVVMIDTFTRNWNAAAAPSAWVRIADKILARAVRKPRANSGPRHYP